MKWQWTSSNRSRRCSTSTRTRRSSWNSPRPTPVRSQCQSGVLRVSPHECRLLALLCSCAANLLKTTESTVKHLREELEKETKQLAECRHKSVCPAVLLPACELRLLLRPPGLLACLFACLSSLLRRACAPVARSGPEGLDLTSCSLALCSSMQACRRGQGASRAAGPAGADADAVPRAHAVARQAQERYFHRCRCLVWWASLTRCVSGCCRGCAVVSGADAAGGAGQRIDWRTRPARGRAREAR